MLTVSELRDILKDVDGDLEIKPYVKDLTSRVSFWYFAIYGEDVDVKDDGLYIELQ